MVPTLLAGPCRLRALQPGDTADWLAIITEPELRRLTSWSLSSIDEVRALISDLTTGPRASTTRRWAIELDERFIGTCGFKAWDRAQRTAELAYELAAEHRGRGLMSAVVAAVLEHGRDPLQLERVDAVVMVDNVASQRLLERAGFLRTATLPAFRACGGLVRDFFRYERRAPARP
jgi:ribosomal-protein-alanine N-acetyltransferase